MGGYGIALAAVRRVLHRGELHYIVFLWHYDYAAGMLAGSLLNSCAALHHAVHLVLAGVYAVGIAVGADVAVGYLVLYAGYGAGPEGVALPEHHLNVLMRHGLIIAREVKVYIRRFIPLEAQEHLEGYLVAKLFVFCAADGAVLIRHVHAAGILGTVYVEVAVPAVGADIVGLQCVYLGYARHVGHEGRAY